MADQFCFNFNKVFIGKLKFHGLSLLWLGLALYLCKNNLLRKKFKSKQPTIF